MKRIYFLPIVFAIAFIFQACEKDSPEDTPQLYMDEVFTSVTKTTVTYSDTFGFEMDIYSPNGDTETNRPVVILAHGGGFFAGTKENPAMIRLAENLAKRGYVAASITYHLASGFAEMLDSNRATALVMKAIGDGRAAIRYMRKSAANGNVFGINPDKIFIAGNSAGAVIALHVGFFDAQDNLTPRLDSIMNANGGFEGFSGNDGYSSAVSGAVNMAGGIVRLSLIDSDDAPVISFHGVDDDVVPANCDDVFTGATGGLDVVNLCGSIPIHNNATSMSINSKLNTYPGGHVPWVDAIGEGNELFDEVEQKSFEFLYENL
jgi:para-nitrobenzyl esterase